MDKWPLPRGSTETCRQRQDKNGFTPIYFPTLPTLNPALEIESETLQT